MENKYRIKKEYVPDIKFNFNNKPLNSGKIVYIPQYKKVTTDFWENFGVGIEFAVLEKAKRYIDIDIEQTQKKEQEDEIIYYP